MSPVGCPFTGLNAECLPPSLPGQVEKHAVVAAYIEQRTPRRAPLDRSQELRKSAHASFPLSLVRRVFDQAVLFLEERLFLAGVFRNQAAAAAFDDRSKIAMAIAR